MQDNFRNHQQLDAPLLPQRPPHNQTNGMGIAGFVLSLLGFLGVVIPIFGFVVWLLGLIFSCIGLKQQPKGLAIAGLVISLISLAIWVFIIAFYAMAISANMR